MTTQINTKYFECENLDIIKVSYSVSYINLYSTRLKKKKRLTKDYKFNSWTEQAFEYMTKNNINVIGKNCNDVDKDYFIVKAIDGTFDYFN